MGYPDIRHNPCILPVGQGPDRYATVLGGIASAHVTRAHWGHCGATPFPGGHAGIPNERAGAPGAFHRRWHRSHMVVHGLAALWGMVLRGHVGLSGDVRIASARIAHGSALLAAAILGTLWGHYWPRFLHFFACLSH